MKTQRQEDITNDIIKTLKEQNKHLLDRLEKAYDDKSELRRQLYNDNAKLRLNMKRGDPIKEGTD